MKKYKLGEIADFNVKAISKSDSLQEIIYLDTSSITENVISDTIIINIEDAPSRAQRRVKNNTIIYSTVRPRLKHYGILNNPQTNFIVSTGFVTIDLKEQYKQIIDPRYLYLLLTQSTITEYIGNIADTAVSAYPSINPADISSLSFNFPSFDLQKSVADIWENYDKKIVLNRQINQNLEAMAKQLYDYWFVQFDFPNENGKPYKSSGGKMVWNEKLKREIPKGWNVLKLGEHCSFNKRTSNGYFNHPILYLDTSNITNNTIDELQFLNPSSDIIPSRARRLVQEGDIVYSTVRPNLKHFGIIMNPDYNMVVSTGFAVITANWSAYRYFIYQFLIQAATIENLSTIAQSAVSAYPSINTSDIENLDLVVPPDSMIEKYAKTACRLYLQIDTNYKEIKSLTKQRDELLPLLMNGQVSVNSDLSLD